MRSDPHIHKPSLEISGTRELSGLAVISRKKCPWLDRIECSKKKVEYGWNSKTRYMEYPAIEGNFALIAKAPKDMVLVLEYQTKR